MKLAKTEIKNYRLLHDVTVTFDDETTTIVGKNNTGKTSLSSIFETFLKKRSGNDRAAFGIEDFSLNCYEKFEEVITKYSQITEENKEQTIKDIQQEIPRIQMFITIKYDQEDNWNVIKPFFTALDENDEITILCEYAPESTEKFLLCILDDQSEVDLPKKIEAHYKKHYKINIRPYSENEETEKVSQSLLQQLVQTKFISAQRVLDDSNTESKSKLSRVFQKQFQNENEQDEAKSGDLLDALLTASNNIDEKLDIFFTAFVGYFQRFGFPGISNEKIELKSQLEPDVLFKNNVKLFYNHDGNILPEKYNGLGYSNLIYIISEIIGFFSETKETNNNLHLIFIEEPEAHMHPQMQNVFIRNINKFLQDVGLRAQVIITTHSSHILSGSNLESIRYFTKVDNQNVCTVKDLMDFNNELTSPQIKEFLIQYLTLGKCDLFFADKAILFEGTVERILLPVFIEKLDSELPDSKLSEQYISSIEVGGAYAEKFKELLTFLGLKTLIITDIDSVEVQEAGRRTKIMVTENDQLVTSNVTLKDWIPEEENILQLLSKPNEDKIAGVIRVAYQIRQNGDDFKCARSFEEAFLIDNYQYIFDNKDSLMSIRSSLSGFQGSDEVIIASYEIQDFIDRNKKKTDFAFDLLNVNRDNWNIPNYIKEGLEWLAL